MIVFALLRNFSALLSGTVNGKERGQHSTSGNKRRREEEDTEDAGMSLLSVHACVSMQADCACMCERCKQTNLRCWQNGQCKSSACTCNTQWICTSLMMLSVSTSLHTLNKLSLRLTSQYS